MNNHGEFPWIHKKRIKKCPMTFTEVNSYVFKQDEMPIMKLILMKTKHYEIEYDGLRIEFPNTSKGQLVVFFSKVV